ncbi:MAG TPA: metallophosphoesterase [Thermoanaerobaculia bacterium]|jgi:3',5'-cyclic AMP phosphodiesterase CpdA|nr:metallophosphoesterase [Thermoanaerobaculia bacterium]
MEPDAVILHLSDLHFSGFLQNVDNIGEWSQVAKTHDFLVLQEMEGVVRPILNKYRDRVVVGITGDLTTAAEPPAYEILTTYLLGKVWVSDKKRVGLGLEGDFGLRERVLVVPGNHDAWLRLSGVLRHLTRWKNYTDRRKLFSEYFGLTPRVVPLLVNGISFMFYLLDSNEMLSTVRNSFNLENALGHGRVGKSQIGKILGEINEPSEKPPQHFNPATAIRIVLMHHHAAIPTEHPVDLEQRLLRLTDGADVQGLFENQLRPHLVLCGHQHFPYLYPDPAEYEKGRPWLSCAGTATQHHSRVNSFKVYYVYAKPRLRGIDIEDYRRERDPNNAAVSKFQLHSQIGIPFFN